MKPIRFVYFDLGNVLLNFSHERAWWQMAAVTGLTADQVRETILGVANNSSEVTPDESRSLDSTGGLVVGSDLQSRYETGQVDSTLFHQEFSERTKTKSACGDLLAAFSDIFKLNQAIMPLISGLLSVKFPMGILSNTCDCHWQFIVDRYPIITDYFPVRILSFEEGAMKPNRRIYEAAIERAGVPAEQIFFCDDRPENVAGAIAAGIDAVLFESTLGLAADLRKRGIDIL